MQQWLEKYSPREQKIIIGVAAVAVLLLAYTLIWAPLGDYQARALRDNAQHQKVWQHVQTAAAKAQQLRQSGQTRQDANTSTVVIVERVLKQFSLPAPQSLNPNGNNQASLRFDAVEFDRLMQALDVLSGTYGIQIKDLSIKSQSDGKVGATLTLTRG